MFPVSSSFPFYVVSKCSAYLQDEKRETRLYCEETQPPTFSEYENELILRKITLYNYKHMYKLELSFFDIK